MMAAEENCAKAADKSGVIAEDGSKTRKIPRCKTDTIAMQW